MEAKLHNNGNLPLCVAVLDTFCAGCAGGIHRRAPAYFTINPYNKTGKRLYWFLDGKYRLLVTNSCKEAVALPSQHGTPDAKWLRGNLTRLFPIDLLLVCGDVAQATYAETKLSFDAYTWQVKRVILMKHPAWRAWSREMLDHTKRNILEGGKW